MTVAFDHRMIPCPTRHYLREVASDIHRRVGHELNGTLDTPAVWLRDVFSALDMRVIVTCHPAVSCDSDLYLDLTERRADGDCNTYLPMRPGSAVIGDVAVIAVEPSLDAPSRRVVLARELGHTLLHCGWPDDRYQLPEKDRLDPIQRIVQADRFASELLVPEATKPSDEMVERCVKGNPIARSIARASTRKLDVPFDWVLLRAYHRLAGT